MLEIIQKQAKTRGFFGCVAMVYFTNWTRYKVSMANFKEHTGKSLQPKIYVEVI